MLGKLDKKQQPVVYYKKTHVRWEEFQVCRYSSHFQYNQFETLPCLVVILAKNLQPRVCFHHTTPEVEIALGCIDEPKSQSQTQDQQYLMQR